MFRMTYVICQPNLTRSLTLVSSACRPHVVCMSSAHRPHEISTGNIFPLKEQTVLLIKSKKGANFLHAFNVTRSKYRHVHRTASVQPLKKHCSGFQMEFCQILKYLSNNATFESQMLHRNSVAYHITSALDFNKRGCVRQI